MIRYPAHLVVEAKRLSASGVSSSQISKKLRVTPGSISVWCRGIAGPNRWKSIIKNNERKRKAVLQSERKCVKDLTINKNNAKLICGILYGCEGAKYPASNALMLTNSDPDLIKSFLALLRIGFTLDESKLSVHLQIHSRQNYQKLIMFWSNLLKISTSRFYKPTVTSPNGKKHRNTYYGTCTVKYQDYRIQLKLIGIFREFMRKSVSLEDMPSG